MTSSQTASDLSLLGLGDDTSFLVELFPVVEMAWADGEIQPNEKSLLEAYCEAIVAAENEAAKRPVASVHQARLVLQRLLQRRLPSTDRFRALRAMRDLTAGSAVGAEKRKRALEWAEAIAAVAGRPTIDSRELFWLQAMKRNLEVSI
jgi:hypothetical protein